MADMLCVDTPPTGTTRLSNWARANGDSLGLHYSNELARRIHRGQAYAALNRRSV
jgi:NADH dehydrogenase